MAKTEKGHGNGVQVQKKPVPPNFYDFAIKLRSLSMPFIIKRYIFLFGSY